MVDGVGAFVLPVGPKVGFVDAAALFAGAAEATLIPLGVDQPHFVVDLVLDAGSGSLRQYATTEHVVAAVIEVCSHAVLGWFVEGLAVGGGVAVLRFEGGLEGGEEGEVVDRRLSAPAHHQHTEQSVHHSHAKRFIIPHRYQMK